MEKRKAAPGESAIRKRQKGRRRAVTEDPKEGYSPTVKASAMNTRASIARLKSFRTIPIRLKELPVRGNSLFNHLHIDVRNIIYDHIMYDLLPFRDGKTYSGFVLSCRQAKEEIEVASRRCVRAGLLHIQKRVREEQNAILELPPQIDLHTLMLSVNIGTNMDEVMGLLTQLHFREVQIHFTGYATDHTTLYMVQREIMCTMGRHCNYLDASGEGGTQVLMLSYDLDTRPPMGPYHLRTADFTPSYKDRYSWFCPKNGWPKVEEKIANNMRSGVVTLSIPKVRSTQPDYWFGEEIAIPPARRLMMPRGEDDIVVQRTEAEINKGDDVPVEDVRTGVELGVYPYRGDP